jgi:2'-phosphotransferase
MASLIDRTVHPSLTKSEKELARSLTKLLRHMKPQTQSRLQMRPDGYVRLAAISGLMSEFKTLTLNLARAIVAEDNKQRFSLVEESGDWFIRANQGHTVAGLDDDLLLTRITSAAELPVVVHGTYLESWPQIRAGGLSRMARNHVHFASGLPSASGVISGMRKSSEVLVYVDAAKTMAAGIEFFRSANGVILTVGPVPPCCFAWVLDARTRDVLFTTSANAVPPAHLLSSLAELPAAMAAAEVAAGAYITTFGGSKDGKGGGKSQGGKRSQALSPNDEPSGGDMDHGAVDVDAAAGAAASAAPSAPPAQANGPRSTRGVRRVQSGWAGDDGGPTAKGLASQPATRDV